MAQKSANPPQTASAPAGSDADMAAVMARARWLMLISAVTTAVAIAALLGVIGYRVFAGSGSAAGTISTGLVLLPAGARVVSTSISGGSIVVTLDVNGATEVRIFDRKTMQQTGRLSFGTEKH